jgi:translation initiation factor IF-3
VQHNSKINERITATRVVLISADGENRGEMPKFTALQEARAVGLDLVEVSPGRVPTCKVMDFGKIKYQRSKSEKHQKHTPQPKEMRISYNIGDHDLEIKLKKIREFLEGGHKVTFSMQVRGRERYVGKSSAKDKFHSIVKILTETFKATPISENERGYSTTLTP